MLIKFDCNTCIRNRLFLNNVDPATVLVESVAADEYMHFYFPPQHRHIFDLALTDTLHLAQIFSELEVHHTH